MSPNSEQQIVLGVQALNGKFDEFRAVVLDPDGGRLPVAERRLNAHADQIDGLLQAQARLPCTANADRLAKVEATTSRLRWLAGILTGGILMLAWLLQMAVDLLKLKMH